ncbi:MAG TPA: hypothetical protein VMS40_14050 [Vicinamibacterales bacterium]|nr:hypothetical protein [Vicinamibacterales bacterium]
MRLSVSALGALIALLAALHKMLYASVLVNDDFMHRAYALQLLAGEWPIRDFFDYGMVLMYVVSALAQMIFGYRLLAEAIVIGIMVGASTYLVFDLVRRLTASNAAATLSAVLFVVAMPRSYGYPKLIVYAVSAVLWWQYVRKPAASRAIALGAWTAIAFYWRPDHGAYVAIGVTLAMIAAHGVSVQTLRECVRAGVVTIALVAPWLAFAAVEMHGLGRFVESGMTAAVEEHIAGQTIPRWPLNRLSDLVTVDRPEAYAPSIGLRWTRDSSAESRQQVIDRYGLTVVATRDEVSQTARVSERTIDAVRALIAEPIVEDTDGIDRGAAQISESTWPPSQRRRFDHWWLRLNVLPRLSEQLEGGEISTILLFALPLAAIALAVPLRPYLPAAVTSAQLVCFALFALIVNVGVLRAPFYVRVGDAIVLPGIILGVLVMMAARATQESRVRTKWIARSATAVVIVLLVKSLAGAGQSAERINWVAGEWESFDRSRAAREEVVGRLMSSPPIDYWQKRNPEVTLRLAAYARECVPESERILVLWFAPEIYYYSDRLMATRHAFFLSEFGNLPTERDMEIDKIRRWPPAVVFTRAKSERPVRKAFPEVMDLLARDYHVAGSVKDDDPYQILVRTDRTPVRDYGAERWPCYR